MKQNNIDQIKLLGYQNLLPGLKYAMNELAGQIKAIESILSDETELNDLRKPKSKYNSMTDEKRAKLSKAGKMMWKNLSPAKRKAKIKAMNASRLRKRNMKLKSKEQQNDSPSVQ